MNQLLGDQWDKRLYSSSNIICIMDTEPSRSELYGARNPYHDIRCEIVLDLYKNDLSFKAWAAIFFVEFLDAMC